MAEKIRCDVIEGALLWPPAELRKPVAKRTAWRSGDIREIERDGWALACIRDGSLVVCKNEVDLSSPVAKSDGDKNARTKKEL